MAGVTHFASPMVIRDATTRDLFDTHLLSRKVVIVEMLDLQATVH